LAKGPEYSVGKRLAADPEIGEGVAQNIGDRCANRFVFTVKAKPRQRPSFAKFDHVVMHELSGGGANAVHPYRLALESLDSIAVFSAVKPSEQIVPRFAWARLRDADEPIGAQRYVQGGPAEPRHCAAVGASEVL
jgi:hypothetical protein